MSLRSIKFGVSTKSGMHELRFDREVHGGVTFKLYSSLIDPLPYCIKEFTAEEWATIVAVLAREYTDVSYCEAVDRQLPEPQSAHEKAERLAERIAK